MPCTIAENTGLTLVCTKGFRALSGRIVADGRSFIADQVDSNRETNGDRSKYPRLVG